MEAELSLEDLLDVLTAAYPARNKWYYIGLNLGITADTLEAIKGQFDDPKDCLCEVLKPWLKGISPRASWRALVDALRNIIVGEDKLASKLEKQYCPIAAQDQGIVVQRSARATLTFVHMYEPGMCMNIAMLDDPVCQSVSVTL